MASKRKSTIPEDVNPLSTLVGQSTHDNAVLQEEKDNKQNNQEKRRKQRKEVKQEYSSRKIRFTVNIPEDLIEDVKKCVFYTPGMTLSRFTIEAFIESIRNYEKANGEKFPERTGELPTGRPPK